MMFSMPTKGFATSITEHNCALEPFVDWVEGSVLFLGEAVSRSDLVDCLIENSIYQKQGFAHEWLDVAFTELRRRLRLISDKPPLRIDGSRIERDQSWQAHPAYSFCLALALQIHYRKAVQENLGVDYGAQGRLFEKLTAELLEANDWEVASVGWSREASESVEAKVRDLAAAIGEDQRPGAVNRWAEPKAKDAGLDLVAWQPFPDGWSGRPICLMQCASGEDWHNKLHTPDTNIWRQLVAFATEPRRGLAMPFAPEADVFRRRAAREGVMLLLDRHRLMHTKAGCAYPSAALAKELIQWTQTRVNCFPRN